MALQKLPKNKGDLGKLIVTKSFKKLPKVQKIAQYGHIGCFKPCIVWNLDLQQQKEMRN